MKKSLMLESKEVRVIIAKFLGIRLEDVLPTKYSFSISNISEEEIMEKLCEDAD